MKTKNSLLFSLNIKSYKMRNAVWYILFLPIFLLGCCGVESPNNQVLQPQNELKFGRITHPTADTLFHLGDTLHIEYANDSIALLDSVVLSVMQRPLTLQPTGQYPTADWEVGVHWLQVSFWHDGQEQVERRKLRILASAPPVDYTYVVEKEYPHDPEAYTQGLLLRNGYLYESTGQRGASSLRKVEITTGKVVQQRDLAAQYFGEGLEYLNGKLFQLTWTGNTCFIYDFATFEPRGSFNYNTQGWGLTTDGTALYLSDGTENIYVLDSATYRVARTLQVYTEQGPLYRINELEWVDGRIYANVYTTDLIAIINPSNGVVEGLVHLEGLLRPSANGIKAEVLNGIAYDPHDKKFYVTGKYWPYLYRVKFLRKYTQKE